MDKKPLIGIVICILLITNVSVVLGNTGENPRRNTTGMETNLAPNPSFEEGDIMPTGWTYAPDANGTFTWDSNYAYSGEKSVGVLNLTNAYPYRVMWITTDFIPVNCTKTSYMFSAWFKFVDIPEYQFAYIRILHYNINYQQIGSGGAGRAYNNTEWHQITKTTGYDGGSTKYVKLELGQAFNIPYEPNPLIEIRFDDVNFSIWNTVPDTPTIKGETRGRVRTLYDYTFTTNDPEQDNVSYEIEWGDNTTQTTDFYESGEKVIISHIWGIERTYSIRVRATDEHHAKSDWATLDVTMPYLYRIDYRPRGFFNLQFSLIVSWNASQIQMPILPGETREVNQTIAYTVNKGLLGNLLLQLLKGKSFLIQLSIEDKPDWCEAWFLPENMTGVVAPGEIGIQYSSLFIGLKENAPGNYTIGTIKIRGTIKDMKGPFHIITLIQGFEHDYALNFQAG